MSIGMTPYLSFGGNAREAMEFYKSVFGGELSVLTFAEGMGEKDPEQSQKVMHSSLFLERGIHLMASDPGPGCDPTPNGTISLSSDGSEGGDGDTLRGWWDRLAADATITMALEEAPWGDSFGQLTDGFGINWMFNITAAHG
ncbi:MAG: VOC family protein [Arthrobacter sp.]|uniref:VOC family protein n=1 Tax=unclassified Arthrobacter TaxID=235627 RepID=UPI0026567E5A|nr:VOC family protein [Micrococcaceae bacterium]MDN5813125.1 VOC family protein [Micrococcaceae bacterium]MDN5823072.1 VOC family protein [Micrococcaceae bacterium]MDN5878345.1 VOC family protein [Micrococcaceae bacterium]MDN5885940.1 VOC family protein [Micrococcaceae bacterium]